MKIYLSNLSKNVTEDDLCKAFETFGEVVSVELMPQKSAAILEVPEASQAWTAIESLKGKNLKGKPLRIAGPGKRSEKQGPRRHAGDRKGGARGGGRKS